jgi:hypothetical protein
MEPAANASPFGLNIIFRHPQPIYVLPLMCDVKFQINITFVKQEGKLRSSHFSLHVLHSKREGKEFTVDNVPLISSCIQL